MYESSYVVTEIENGLQVEHKNTKMVLFQLRGGQALVVGLTHANLKTIDAQRADDYIHGLLDALVHVQMTASIPVVKAV